MTSAANSEPIDGMAILIAEAINGVKKEANVATINAIYLLLISFSGLQDFSVLTNYSSKKFYSIITNILSNLLILYKML